MKRTVLWAGVAIVVVGAIWGLVKLAGELPPLSSAILTDAVSDSDWMTGNSESEITLVEYSDFQCPACAAYHPLVKKLISEQGDNFRFVYRHFPLPQHTHAKSTAYAAEAAGRQGKFWEMHDLIFSRQTEWVNDRNIENALLEFAATLGLDTERFSDDYRSAEINDKVEADWQSGLNAGVNATPTFFLNGRQIQPRSFEEFVDLINQTHVASL